MPCRDSISRPITLASSVAGGDDTTRPRRRAGAAETKFCSQIACMLINANNSGTAIFVEVQNIERQNV
jgi:hypothetical protein